MWRINDGDSTCNDLSHHFREWAPRIENHWCTFSPCPPLRQPGMAGSTPSALTPVTCIFFVSFFLGWWIPSWILELSGWCPPNESLGTDACLSRLLNLSVTVTIPQRGSKTRVVFFYPWLHPQSGSVLGRFWGVIPNFAFDKVVPPWIE